MLPPEIEVLHEYADEQGWEQPSWYESLLDDVLEDFEEGITVGKWELLFTLLKHNNRLDWYEIYSLPHKYRPYFFNGRVRFPWQSFPVDPTDDRLQIKLDEHGLAQVVLL